MATFGNENLDLADFETMCNWFWKCGLTGIDFDTAYKFFLEESAKIPPYPPLPEP